MWSPTQSKMEPLQNAMNVSQLSALIDSLFPGSVIEDLEKPDHKMIVSPATKKRLLLYVKPIIGEPAFFNMSISNRAFGPELIHEDDLRRLQGMMQDLEVTQCVYVLHSTDKQIFSHQFTFPIDHHYLQWIDDQ